MVKANKKRTKTALNRKVRIRKPSNAKKSNSNRKPGKKSFKKVNWPGKATALSPVIQQIPKKSPVYRFLEDNRVLNVSNTTAAISNFTKSKHEVNKIGALDSTTFISLSLNKDKTNYLATLTETQNKNRPKVLFDLVDSVSLTPDKKTCSLRSKQERGRSIKTLSWPSSALIRVFDADMLKIDLSGIDSIPDKDKVVSEFEKELKANVTVVPNAFFSIRLSGNEAYLEETNNQRILDFALTKKNESDNADVVVSDSVFSLIRQDSELRKIAIDFVKAALFAKCSLNDFTRISSLFCGCSKTCVNVLSTRNSNFCIEAGWHELSKGFANAQPQEDNLKKGITGLFGIKLSQ